MQDVRRVRLLSAAVATAFVAACAPYQDQYAYQPAYQPPPQAYQPPPAERGRVVAPVAYNTGVIQAIDPIRSGSSSVSPVGAVLGAVVGGFLGNQVGAGTGKALATGAGVVGGALAGNAVGTRAERPDTTFRVSIAYDGGGGTTIDVPDPAGLRVGERVRVDGNQISRY